MSEATMNDATEALNRIKELEEELKEREDGIDVSKVINKIVGRSTVPEVVTYVKDARRSAVGRSSTNVTDQEDETDYS